MTPRPPTWRMRLVAGCANSPPGAPEVRIEPAAPGTLDALVALVAGEAKDADGDEVSYSFSRFKDGGAFPDIGSSDTVPRSSRRRGRCGGWG